MDYAGLISRLIREPFCYTPEEIGRLTLWQLEHVFARDPSKGAKRIVKGDGSMGGPVEDPKSLFFKIYRRRGLTEQAIEALWVEQDKKIKASLERARGKQSRGGESEP